MRRSVIAVLVLLAAIPAAAGIESVEPKEFVTTTAEEFIHIIGTDLGKEVYFSGKAGEFKLEINATTQRGVMAWVPGPILATPGRYIIEAGGSQATFDVVQPRTGHPLVVLVPDPIAAPATTRTGTDVRFEVSPFGGQDPNPRISCDRASPSFFTLGAHRVRCEASNSFGETAEGFVFVTVYDAHMPILKLPTKRIVVKAESLEGAKVSYEASAYDELEGELEIFCNPRSGSLFPIGLTDVVCSATDASKQTTVGSFEVEVIDEKTLILDMPDRVVVEAENAEGAHVEFEVTASGSGDPKPVVKCDPESGSFFKFGVNTVRCEASDRFDNRAEGSFEVHVVDTIGPVVSRILASPDWIDPSGLMVGIGIKVDTVDMVDPMPRCSVFDVTSNQQIDRDDWKLTGDLELEVRAEMDKTGDRLYFVHVKCTDKFDNATTTAANVTVSKSEKPPPTLVGAPPSGKRRAGGK